MKIDSLNYHMKLYRNCKEILTLKTFLSLYSWI